MNSSAGQLLYQSILNENLESVCLHLNSGITNLEERDQDGQTFLMLACQLGNYDIVAKLLEETPDTDIINATDNDNWTALLNAAKQGSSKIIGALLDAGADIEHRDLGSWTALMWTCYKGRTDAAIELLSRDANPNVKGEHHMSCLTWAAGRGHTRIVRELLAHGAKVNTADKYGTTPLIWASRKGHTEIVDMLLREGAMVDKAGMNSWTALTVAATGGYTDVVRLLLVHSPYVNAVDKDGYTALAIAAKEGYVEIISLLLQSEAYVNIPDRYGDTILIHAVKGNHVEIARLLLKKYADIDVQGVDDKTALYWAVEKGYISMTKVLLEFSANTEIANKDGDTPLLKAVRKRNLDLVQLLVDAGAKVSASDKRGDNALHISVRGRSKRITECLLRNPKNARLLYNKNKNSETAYEIDATHERSVLTQVFGARNLNADDNLQGYELYSSAIADVLSEPSLRTPITVGLFARWGSGKSFLISRLRKEMETFAQFSAEISFEFNVLQFIVSFMISVIVGLIFGVSLSWPIGVGIGGGLLLFQYVFLVCVWFCANKKEWPGAKSVSRYFAKKFQFLKLFLQLMFCNVPVQLNRDVSAIRFLFTDNAHLNTLMGEKSITAIVTTLCDALENEYGILVPRLYRIFKPRKAAEHGRFKSLCCMPYFVIVLFVFTCLIAVLLMIAIFKFHSFLEENYTVVNSIMIALGSIVCLAVLGNIYTWSRMILHVAIPTRKHVQRISRQFDVLKMDGFIQMLKKEVETIGRMTRCMDAFTGNHSRLVVIIDGLDSCEQDKLLHVLDMVHMLFGDTNSPFVTILAVDPHVIIKGIEQNLRSSFHESSINGYDYLRNIIQLPFFIQNQTVPKPPPRNLTKLELSAADRGGESSNPPQSLSVACHRQESYISGASYLSLTDIGKSGKGRRQKQQAASGVANTNFGSTTLVRQPSMYDLSKSLGKSSYFSDINPRSMKRLMNILAITGRLLRAYNFEFNWYKLASWINLTEQWPYRLSWIILEVEDNSDIEDTQSLKNVYDRVSQKIPSSRDVDPLVEIDRNVRKLEVFLTNSAPPMTVADMKRFLPCTINVDPYLRKLIRELQQNTDNMNAEYGHLMTNMGSSFDQPGWLGSRHGGGGSGTLGFYASRRQPQGGVGGNSRQTPTHPYASMFPSTFPNPSTMQPYPMMMNPMMPHAYMQMLEMQQANVAMKPTTPKIKVNVQGGIGKKPLSAMTLDDIADLVQRVDGLNKSMVPEYIGRLRLNNINGTVLYHCNLVELKPVMSMSFGDWELFQGLINILRENELSANGTADVAKTPYSELETSSYSQAVPGFSCPMEVPKVTHPSNSCAGAAGQPSTSKWTSSDLITSRLSSSATEFGSVGSSTPTMLRKAAANNMGIQAGANNDIDGFKQQQQQQAQQFLSVRLPLNRQDSFVNEVMMESEALRDFIEATVDSSSSETEEVTEKEAPRGISPIPEETVVPDVSRYSSTVSLIGPKTLSRHASQESSNPGDKAFVVGPDNDSGESDSDEVERLSRKSSTVRKSTQKSPQRSHATAVVDQNYSNSSMAVSGTMSSAEPVKIDAGRFVRKTSLNLSKPAQRHEKVRNEDSAAVPLISGELKHDSTSSSNLSSRSHATVGSTSSHDESQQSKKCLPFMISQPSESISANISSSYPESFAKEATVQASQSSLSKLPDEGRLLLGRYSFSGPSSTAAFDTASSAGSKISSGNVFLDIDAESNLSHRSVSESKDADMPAAKSQIKIGASDLGTPTVTYINSDKKRDCSPV